MAGIKDKLKSLVGIHEDPYYTEYDEEDEDYTQDEALELESTETRVTTKSREENTVSTSVGSGLKPKLVIHEPITYEDGPKILDDIKNKKIVVIDFETLDGDKKKQIFEFVNGGIYSMEAQIRKVTKDIFVVAPKGVDVEGKQLDNFSLKSDYTV